MEGFEQPNAGTGQQQTSEQPNAGTGQQQISEQQQNNFPAATTRPDMSRRLKRSEKDEICHKMVLNFNNGKLKHGTINKIAAEYGFSRCTISGIWRSVLGSIKAGTLPDTRRRYKGSKRTYLDLEQVRAVPLPKRSNIRSIAIALKIPRSTVHRLLRREKIRAHSNAIKPFLTEDNMKERMLWVLSQIDKNNMHETPEFDPMYNVVHIDEKWFYMTKVSAKYYLLPDENKPYRTCKSKRFITKIMFMSAVARPIFDADGNCIFDGKIGIFPFIVSLPAKRSSKNRARGVLEMKPIDKINKMVIKDCILQKVLPTLKAKWPADCTRDIIIQQDNARPHLHAEDEDFVRDATSDGFNIRLVCQPPNSPDMNVLDLGFFRAIQGLQYEKCPKNVVQLVDAVMRAYEETSVVTLNYVWLSLQNCMIEVLKYKGSNKYPLPHVGKRRLARLGILPKAFHPSKELVEQAMCDVGLTGTEP